MERNPVALDVNVDVDNKVVADLTAAELMHVAWQRADNELSKVVAEPDAGPIIREFSLCKTHLEDAITRFNKGWYRAAGTYAISDAERVAESATVGGEPADAS